MNEDIIRLEISVHYIQGVKVLQASKDLEADAPNYPFIQGLWDGTQIRECSTIAVVKEEIMRV